MPTVAIMPACNYRGAAGVFVDERVSARVLKGPAMRRYVFVLSLILLAGCAPTHGAASGPGATVPSAADIVLWLDSPALPPAEPTATVRPTARPCAAADLPTQATTSETGGISQTESAFIDVRSVGPSRCTLFGRPVLLYADSHGRMRPLPTTDFTIWKGPATVDPGETARVLVTLSHACTGPWLTRTGFVVVAAGRQIRVPSLSLSGTCPEIGVSSWFTNPAEPPVPAPRYSALTASIDAPATVRAGGQLDYIVTVTNPGSTPVALDPCPVYRESFFKNLRTYLLNCAPETVPAGGSVRFAMRVTVLAYTPAGPNRLYWALTEVDGESAPASASVTVTS